jgi:hypothetical protein
MTRSPAAGLADRQPADMEARRVTGRCAVPLVPKGAKEGLRRWVGICAGCGRRLYLEAWEAG